MKQTIALCIVAICGLLCARAVGQTGGPSLEDEFLRAVAADSAASKPATGTGTIIVQAIQGTKGGPKVGGDKVLVELLCQHGQIEKRLEGVLDAAGLATFPDAVPAGGEMFQPIVTVTHAGFPYQSHGEPARADSPDQVIKVNVNEITAAPPLWTIQTRHVVISPVPEGLGVTEKLVVVNPTDRTWMPAKAGPTVVLSLPLGATKVELLNPGDDPVPGNVADGQLFLPNPMPPGTSRISLQYVVPLVNGEAEIELKAPASTASTLVIVPEGGIEIKGNTLTPQELEVKNLRGYAAPELATGQSLNFIIGIAAANPPETRSPASKPKGNISIVIIASDGVWRTVLIVCGIAAGIVVAWLLFKTIGRKS